MCHSFLIIYYWNDTEFLTLPRRVMSRFIIGFGDRLSAHLLYGGSYTELFTVFFNALQGSLLQIIE
ncbi:hypothetical protein YEP4_20386 [Yersinia enterocolitica subsp. palearctica YE-P4]|uniref:Uncharacterized protein n=1 Tax=Yersinia enterocolitica TaxID=630 RepID=A0A0H5F089_YEREN|nr:hypothetical protein YE150_20410 [Yersinia enterocolitica subsp. palearctica YE-150]EOR64613.1 hypothetical protein YEP4_20386 [Yersinia enterocolitica subsp. palearctica YE-P4]EOR64836.1 hypothetical protein YEP1_20456 [Yersinia enterocolitica subsp. palearctica YE-P1]EOR65919.1 hypothetical protein YE149_20453 [Yersinia enterocolitica subsp. palearctica YE-149]MDW9427153.1 hypothetical protein [Yersinia enterocolitica]OAM66796.1 hypothetical protein A8L35_20000 [Yersinia enterocolitica su